MRSSGYATLATWRTRHSTTSRRPVLGRGGAHDGRRCLQQSARGAHVLGDPRPQRHHPRRSALASVDEADRTQHRDTECRRCRQCIAQMNGIVVPRGTPRQPAAIQLPLTHVRRGAHGRWGARARAVVYRPWEAKLERHCAHHRRSKRVLPIAATGAPGRTTRTESGRTSDLFSTGSSAQDCVGGNDRRRRSPTWLTRR